MAIEELKSKEEMTNISISLPVEMKEQIEALCKDRSWKVSPFIRVCIQKEFEALKGK